MFCRSEKIGRPSVSRSVSAASTNFGAQPVRLGRTLVSIVLDVAVRLLGQQIQIPVLVHVGKAVPLSHVEVGIARTAEPKSRYPSGPESGPRARTARRCRSPPAQRGPDRHRRQRPPTGGRGALKPPRNARSSGRPVESETGNGRMDGVKADGRTGGRADGVVDLTDPAHAATMMKLWGSRPRGLSCTDAVAAPSEATACPCPRRSCPP